MSRIKVPYLYDPRQYQVPFLTSMGRGVLGLPGGTTRGVAIWHRRAGKDLTALAGLVVPESLRRPGIYYHFLPTYKQGRKIIWDGRDKTGRKFLDYFPPDALKSQNNQEMKIELSSGSLFQVIGTDDIDSIVGTNPVGCVFSEYSLQHPQAWDYVRPIIRENGGWAVFLYTPRGKNHGYKLFNMAKQNPSWFCEMLTVFDTRVLTEADIQEEREAGMNEELIQQEFFCSWNAPLTGAYYGSLMDMARFQGRITKVKVDTNIPVHTAWDLGMHDSMAIWFVQVAGREVWVVDYYENSGEGLAHYARVLDEKRREGGWIYGTHYAPHDIEVRELGTGRTRREVASDLGIDFQVIKRHDLMDGIEAVRVMLPMCYFDEAHCLEGIDCLEQYRKEWDEKRGCYKSRPVHDASSHGADGFRTLAMGLRLSDPRRRMTKDEVKRLDDLYAPPY
jgi:phage terminase large subunit